MTDSLILMHADVYSSVDPFATAIMLTGDTVAWVGSDEAAAAFDGEHRDHSGAFITPGLVSAGLDLRPTAARPARSGAELLAAGVTAAHVIGTAEQLADFRSAAPEALAVTAYQLGESAGGVEVLESELPERSVFVLIDDTAELTAALQALRDPQRRAHAQRWGWRLLISTSVASDAVEELAALGLGITLDPLAHPQPLAPLLAAGGQLSFALSAANPWETLRAAVYAAADGISARAAFNAVTRFGHRAVGDVEGGVLAPGAQATVCIWQVGDLLVQAADSRVAAWSTDPRSGTPGLPDLSPDAPLPQLTGLIVAGADVAL